MDCGCERRPQSSLLSGHFQARRPSNGGALRPLRPELTLMKNSHWYRRKPGLVGSNASITSVQQQPWIFIIWAYLALLLIGIHPLCSFLKPPTWTHIAEVAGSTFCLQAADLFDTKKNPRNYQQDRELFAESPFFSQAGMGGNDIFWRCTCDWKIFVPCMCYGALHWVWKSELGAGNDVTLEVTSCKPALAFNSTLAW